LEEYCDRIWGKRKPVILDAFAGGGSIPFEAARYGLNVLASDLNPVAVMTMKAAMEYPLKFGADLQQDIDKWVKFVGDEAEKRLAEFFPSQPEVGANDHSPVQNYLWAHTVVCPLYAVAYRSGKSSLEFRSPQQIDFDGIEKSKIYKDGTNKNESKVCGIVETTVDQTRGVTP
jgi:hypothetical protein